MNCPNCKNELKQGATFCSFCGFNVKEFSQRKEDIMPQIANVNQKKKSSAKAIIISVVSILLVVVIALFVYFKFFDKSGDISMETPPLDYGYTEPDNDIVINEEDEKEDKKEVITSDIKEFIDSNGYGDYIGCAIIDNKTGDKYYINNVEDSFVAWGFYLPVYMAFKDNFGDTDSDIIDSILSNEASLCNQSANYAIDYFGSVEEITSYINNELDARSTMYQRRFGDVNSKKDNYTSPADAVKFLYALNETGEYSRLCYNTKSFGVDSPYGTDVYAQMGTENINKKENLNMFAIIKSSDYDLSVSILTKNSVGSDFVTELLEFIDNEFKN